jgi:hypothetical protein
MLEKVHSFINLTNSKHEEAICKESTQIDELFLLFKLENNEHLVK